MIKKVFQKIDLNEPEYVENYGDQFSAVQMIFYIAKKSIFINFIKNRNFYIFYIFRIFLKKRGGRMGAVWGPYGVGGRGEAGTLCIFASVVP